MPKSSKRSLSALMRDTYSGFAPVRLEPIMRVFQGSTGFGAGLAVRSISITDSALNEEGPV